MPSQASIQEREDMTKRIALIIPFYNERKRLNKDALKYLAQECKEFMHCYLIDDGSTDNFAIELINFASNEQLKNVTIINSPTNRGKAEAIRFAVNSLNLNKYSHFGFTDADFSASPSEIVRLARIALDNPLTFVFGSRAQNAKNKIKTSRFRFVQGTIFNLFVSSILGNKLADSQCGLKFFPIDCAAKQSLFKIPFKNKWLFDLELIMRISKIDRIDILEISLYEWSHMKNSKTSILDLPDIIYSVIWLRIKYKGFKNVVITRS